LLLGFNIGGDRGKGVKEGRCCLPFDEELLFHVAVDGGESGMEEPGIGLLFSDLIGLDLSGLGNADLEMVGGEGGGDGVDVVDRKVGRSQSPGDSTISFWSGR
jgi:hypothetical protein